jgi:hypothetical protein
MEIVKGYKGKACQICGKRLPGSYEGDECSECRERKLFFEVRDFIWNNEVSEVQLAQAFDIPQRKIRQWINEGKIQLGGGNCGQSVYGHCARCGEPLDYGNYCPTCLRLIKREKQTASYIDLTNLRDISKS